MIYFDSTAFLCCYEFDYICDRNVCEYNAYFGMRVLVSGLVPWVTGWLCSWVAGLMGGWVEWIVPWSCVRDSG